jgi:hypothetical protein
MGKWTLIKLNAGNLDLSDIFYQNQVHGIPTLSYFRGDTKLYQKSGLIDDSTLRSLQSTYLLSK